MPVLDILAQVDKVLENPAWLMFGIAGGIGLLGFLALLFLYPFAGD